MDNLLGIKPRSAFIGVCFAMMGVDEMIDQRELTKLFEVLDRFGFDEEEIMKEMSNFTDLSLSEAMRYGQKSMAAITGLDSEMRDNLVQALTEIAISDEYFHDAEKTLLSAVKITFGIPE
ncbi:MAG: TerB family tellurite resistance protein [Candidatus Marinimicrobia bacterium]|nr:TerB family tellurite resistance protein [Candidatus Neomarinimicrobiota bacterium]